MSSTLPSRYDPHEAQSRWYPLWEAKGLFHNEPDERRPYSIVIPPPNVTGALHMGHALNNTLQDVLVRWRRMQGYNTLWMPGTDHAGIATQAVVERRLNEEQNLTRHDIGREKLVERIWAWKENYEARILNQLRQLGSCCDWQRTRFTLDPICARAVRHTFFRMFRDELIYRGQRLVNWDTHLQTAVANDEIFHEKVQGNLWTFRYPVVGTDEFICIATTRPETMLGDTAVAVHPEDPRYKHLIGKLVNLPLTGREIPIIADGKLVDREFGTGCVKVTPAHDPNDYETGLRHQLPMINILTPQGTINENGGKFEGLDRYQARTAVVAELQELDLVEAIEDYETEVGHSDRSKTPIEPFLSDQWFVKMERLAETAIDAVRSARVNITPSRYAKSYLDWLGEKRDWCISRQLWWGHRIPVWRQLVDADRPPEQLERLQALLGKNWPADQVCVQLVDRATGALIEDPAAAICRQIPQSGYEILVCLLQDNDDFIAQFEAAGLEQDPDVLDTWFSSALWPHSTLGWPEPTSDLEFYYPTATLVTSRDIITLWVARMVMTGIYNRADVPFRDVYIHPKILDGFGQSMSKSKGNGVDPLDIVARYGADALRFALVSLTTETQDSRMPVGYECPHCQTIVAQKIEHQRMKPKNGVKPRIACPKCKKKFQFSSPNFDPDPGEAVATVVSERFEQGRNFANKLWNASRFALMNLKAYQSQPIEIASLGFEERWILSRLCEVETQVTEALERFRFSEVSRLLYEFSWSEFCDWYIEMAKLRLQDQQTRATAQRVLATVLDHLLRLLHPVVPFLTEQIWSSLAESAPQRGLSPAPPSEFVMTESWPVLEAGLRDIQVERRMDRLQEVIRTIRNLRSQFNVDHKARVSVTVKCTRAIAIELSGSRRFIEQLAGVGELEVGPDVQRPNDAAAIVAAEWELYVPLTGLIDLNSEITRNQRQRDTLEKQIAAAKAKLGNESFVARAPQEVVDQARQRLAELESQLAATNEILTALGGS